MKFKLLVVVLVDGKSLLTRRFENCRVRTTLQFFSVLCGEDVLTFLADDIVSISCFTGD